MITSSDTLKTLSEKLKTMGFHKCVIKKASKKYPETLWAYVADSNPWKYYNVHQMCITSEMLTTNDDLKMLNIELQHYLNLTNRL